MLTDVGFKLFVGNLAPVERDARRDIRPAPDGPVHPGPGHGIGGNK